MRKKANHKSRLAKKLLLAFAGTLTVIVMAVTMIGTIILMFLGNDKQIEIVYVSQLIMIILFVAAFGFIVEKMIIRRIRKLNDAMKDVAKGNYEITVPIEKNDELSELSGSFNKMTAELKSNAFLSRDFTRYVSHEFKTPLSVIRSHAEAAQYADTKEESDEYIQIVIEETDRLAEISKNIMELCRLESTTIIPKKDTFSPASQIRTVILAAQFAWGAKNINIDLNIEEFEITSSESLLFRVWENLIGNAVKFTEQNGNIVITLKRQDGGLLFSVADDGVGISDDDKNKVFDPFFTGDKSHNKEGSGLGLPLSKNIIEKLGGTITFTSMLGKGTEFSISLPL